MGTTLVGKIHEAEPVTLGGRSQRERGKTKQNKTWKSVTEKASE